ncbi:MAG: M20/M25/M40 family metallo-hydrolase [Gemmatimonadales bacterium]|nr:M20/M25/M40 family metallo-hydrolase [Gemmatimonadales bacterium]
MKSLFLSLAILATLASAARGQRAAPPEARVTAALRAHDISSRLHFLADDLLEGRGTGARGGEIAAQYIAAQFMGMGIEPAGDSGTYFHHVPIITLVPAPAFEVTGGAPARTLRYADEYVAWAERSERLVSASGELVFVGFGITAPEWQWDDYKGMDVRGKILVMLVNDPGLRDPSIFRGRILTYYGRWTYKLEEAARRGAAGVLLVHNDTMATYGWSTVRNSWTGDQVRLDRPPTSLSFAGWITQGALADLMRAKGLELGQLMNSAARRDFRPVATGIELRGTVRSAMRRTTTANVVGRLAGSDPALRDEVVMISSHYDHIGVAQQPVNGDSILNGALDNASGVATILAVADAFVRTGVRPRRSLLFVAVAAEEKGLLGSQALAERPPVPLALVAAVLNFDVANLFGATRDIAVLGGDQSSLGPVFDRAARGERLRVKVDQGSLLRGSFFRSDHFPLARAGVPALSWEHGNEYVGKPAGWGEEAWETFNRDRYHQVTDEILPWYTMEGALQQARVLVRVALAVGNATAQPVWNPSSEFRAAGERRAGPPTPFLLRHSTAAPRRHTAGSAATLAAR